MPDPIYAPTPVPIGIELQVVKYSGHSNDCHNILFLGDGFAVTDQSRFNEAVGLITDSLFQISPFHLLGYQFNVFKAFTPSPSSGITAQGLVDNHGHVISTMELHCDGHILGEMVEKRSALGLVYKDNRDHSLNIYSKDADTDLIPELIRSLNTPYNEANSAIPFCWVRPRDQPNAPVPKDFGLVCVLVNDDYKVANSHGKFVIIAFGGLHWRFTVYSDGTIVDHFPNPSLKIEYPLMAYQVAHEFGHSFFGLADEYTNTGYYTNNNPQIVAAHPNIVTRDELTSLGQFPVFSNNNGSVKWLNKLLTPNDANNKLVSPRARSYMETNQKPLYKSGDKKSGFSSDSDYPDPDFWTQNPDIIKKYPFPAQIIGLYEGAYCSFEDIYRPAGVCLMRGTESGTGKGSFVSLDALPPEVVFPQNLADKIIYDSGRLIYQGIMWPDDKAVLLGLSTDSEYQAAILELERQSNGEKIRTVCIRGFCYVCKTIIIEKSETDPTKLGYLLDELTKEYPGGRGLTK